MRDASGAHGDRGRTREIDPVGVRGERLELVRTADAPAERRPRARVDDRASAVERRAEPDRCAGRDERRRAAVRDLHGARVRLISGRRHRRAAEVRGAPAGDDEGVQGLHAAHVAADAHVGSGLDDERAGASGRDIRCAGGV